MTNSFNRSIQYLKRFFRYSVDMITLCKLNFHQLLHQLTLSKIDSV